MSKKLDNARAILSGEILKQFEGRITGEGVEEQVGKSPENAFYVGKLMSVQDDDNKNNNFSSKTFIDSLGVEFYIDETEINTASVTIYPQGCFYYRVYPKLDDQRDALVKSVNSTKGTTFKDFAELEAAWKANKSAYQEMGINLVSAFRKVDLNYSLTVKLGDLLKNNPDFGIVKKDDDLNKGLQEYLDSVMEEIQRTERFYRFPVYDETHIPDLCDQQKYQDFLNRSGKSDVIVHQNWQIYVQMDVKRVEGQFLVSVNLVNNSDLPSGMGRSKRDDKESIETLFNAGLKVTLYDASFADIEMDYFKDDYKYDRTQKAVGNNCSVVFDEKTNTITTENIPYFIQYRYKTYENRAISFEDLLKDPVKTLTRTKDLMKGELKDWKKYEADQVKAGRLTAKGKNQFDREIEDFEREISRFERGINVINNYQIVDKSFRQMNRAFANNGGKYTTWRLFQIVFIVSVIPDIVSCDENVMPIEERNAIRPSLDSMALLYFPTGGGKTEAFLGILIFNLFFDRYRNKRQGVTGILRYPLRLLSVQQVQRVSNILAQAELLRREDKTISDSDEFALGYFVGDNNTPNKITSDSAKEYVSMNQEQLDAQRVIDICPFCGKSTIHLKMDMKSYRLMHYCSNPDCPSHGKALPLYIVDTEIYRYLPSVIISTVDKLAIMGNNRNFRAILDGATKKCPKHGYMTTDTCIEGGYNNNCDVPKEEYESVEMYDPAPTLLIQDELHLINESLGAYASHYETYLQYYIRELSKSHRGVKVIGATATISAYDNQVFHLYLRDAIRFPAESPYLDHNFYAYTDDNDIQRRIIGFAPYGKAIINSVVYTMKYMREVIYQYVKDPNLVLQIPGIGIDSIEDAKEILKDYWIFLEYNNEKRDSDNVDGALATPVNDELREEHVPEFDVRKMTGDESFQDVRNVLAEVENSKDVFNGLNMITATSMISHGVDADRFNVMFFYGIPGKTAEYIQAYSRTGRRYTSIVVDLIRPTRETDLSYLKNFVKFHEYKDILVDSVAINRWATKAIDNTVPGIFAALVLDHYDQDKKNKYGNLFMMKNLKRAIENNLIPMDEVKTFLKVSYGCYTWNDSTKSYVERSEGALYSDKIDAFIDDVFEKITNREWLKESLFEGFDRMGYKIMNNLRDTDPSVIIALD